MIIIHHKQWGLIGGLMVSVVDHGFESLSGQIKDCCSSELALYKFNSACWSSTKRPHYHLIET